MSELLPRRVMIIMIAMSMVLILALNNIALSSYLVFAHNNTDKLVITDSIASGDVTDNSTIVWSRANAQAMMHVQYDTNPSFSHAKSKTLLVNKLTDFAGHIKLIHCLLTLIIIIVYGSPLLLTTTMSVPIVNSHCHYQHQIL
jgi:phosphodiesterase/alkaline phosphatase D-like protein